MEQTTGKGNAPEQWNRLLTILDDRLQLGLLDKIRRVASYHLEGGVLYIEPGDTTDEAYLTRDPVMQQLRLFVEDAFTVTEVKIQRYEFPVE